MTKAAAPALCILVMSDFEASALAMIFCHPNVSIFSEDGSLKSLYVL